VLCEILNPVIKEEPVDPKVKKDPKAVKQDEPFTEAEIAQFGARRILYECKSDRDPIEVKFTLRVVYQAPDYEDPNPPEEDENAKKKPPAKGVIEEPKIRMITP